VFIRVTFLVDRCPARMKLLAQYFAIWCRYCFV
jgi:hypothetical protein